MHFLFCFVPNAPCGVESHSCYLTLNDSPVWFLMHRVELKAGGIEAEKEAIKVFLMHRVELKEMKTLLSAS